MVADVAIHEPMGSDGLKQPHAHMLLTTRRLDPSSTTGFARTKERGWNEDPDIALAVNEARKLFNDTRLPEHKAALDQVEALRNVQVWRKAWQDAANRALTQAGSAARIDHRTLEAQGIARPGAAQSRSRPVISRMPTTTSRNGSPQWVAVKKRAALYAELQHYQRRDPVKLAEFVLRLTDMAEGIASQFRRPTPIPEVPMSDEDFDRAFGGTSARAPFTSESAAPIRGPKTTPRCRQQDPAPIGPTDSCRRAISVKPATCSAGWTAPK